MIFPEHCKHVGVSDGARPCRDRVYFLTRYLVVYRDDGVWVGREWNGHGDSCAWRVVGLVSAFSGSA